MLDIDAVADRIGQSEHQTRRLIGALDGVLRPYRKRGANNAILIEQAGVGVLDRAAQLKAEGVPLSELGNRVKAEMGHEDEPAVNGRETAPSNGAKFSAEPCEACTSKDLYIKHLESEVNWLRGRVEDLEVKALPDGRPWWRRIFGR